MAARDEKLKSANEKLEELLSRTETEKKNEEDVRSVIFLRIFLYSIYHYLRQQYSTALDKAKQEISDLSENASKVPVLQTELEKLKLELQSLKEEKEEAERQQSEVISLFFVCIQRIGV